MPRWHSARPGRPLGGLALSPWRGQGEVLEGSSGVSPGPTCHVNRVLGSCFLGLLSLIPVPLTGRTSGPRLGSFLFYPDQYVDLCVSAVARPVWSRRDTGKAVTDIATETGESRGVARELKKTGGVRVRPGRPPFYFQEE